MKFLPFLFFSLFFIPTFSQNNDLTIPIDVQVPETNPKTRRQFFFEGIEFVEQKKELVVVVRSPQTALAEQIGARIYTDTSFLNHIVNTFYRDIQIGRESMHFCGHDVYFYIKSGSNLTLFKQVNSHCGLDELDCEQLELLAQNGRPLNRDTLRVLDFKNYTPQQIFQDGILFTEYVSEEGDVHLDPATFSNNHFLPHFCYDGYFELTINVNQTTPITHYIDSVFAPVPHLHREPINYKLDNTIEHHLNPFDFTLYNLEQFKLTVYLDESCYHFFPDMDIQSTMLPENPVKLGSYPLIRYR